MPIPKSVQGQAEGALEHPGPVKGVPTHGMEG